MNCRAIRTVLTRTWRIKILKIRVVWTRCDAEARENCDLARRKQPIAISFRFVTASPFLNCKIRNIDLPPQGENIISRWCTSNVYRENCSLEMWKIFDLENDKNDRFEGRSNDGNLLKRLLNVFSASDLQF